MKHVKLQLVQNSVGHKKHLGGLGLTVISQKLQEANLKHVKQVPLSTNGCSPWKLEDPQLAPIYMYKFYLVQTFSLCSYTI